MKTYTKESLIKALIEIRERGWIKNARPGNSGGVGNTLEDLLGIKENNLPIPNAAEWELKSQRKKTSSLTTGIHTEPSPTAFKFVSKIFLPNYGWPHKMAGIKYPIEELSFRQTINALSRTDRGFGVFVNRLERKIEVSFDYKKVDIRHKEWLDSVEKRIGLGELEPKPYWGFDDLFHLVGTKLKNCFYVRADSRGRGNNEYFHYNEIIILKGFNEDLFIDAIERGYGLVDFDASTHHNHGTKFRLRKAVLPSLYSGVEII